MENPKPFGKRILSFALAFLLVLSLAPMPTLPVVAASNLTATIDTDEKVTLTDKNGDGYYEIGTADELYAFAALVNGGETSINAILTADIVVNNSELGASSRLWTPIGNNNSKRYQGIFNGAGHTISGLYFNDDTVGNVGLFGYVGADGTVQDVGIIGSYFKGGNGVGGVVCYNAGTVANCYNTGKVNGSWYVGGVVCCNYGTVKKCYNTGTVSGDYYVGGVVGRNNGTVENCYNMGAVSGYNSVGGVVGSNYGTVANCYNTGKVNGSWYVGGVVGGDNDGSIVANCYYLDTACDGGINGRNVEDQAEAKTATQFASGEVAWLLNGSKSDGVWGQKLGKDDFPVLNGPKVYYGYKCAVGMSYSNKALSSETHSPNYDVNGFCTACDAYEPAVDSNSDGFYEIDNAGKLYWFAAQVNSGKTDLKAILTADIVVNNSELGASSRLWTPIGNSAHKYQGTFNGNYKTISGLYVNGSTNYVGLFGYVGSNGTVQDVGILNSYFKGSDYIGGVVGRNNGTVANCNNEGTVSGNYAVGGVVGSNYSTVTNCYNAGAVCGIGDKKGYIGGVVGGNYSGTVTNCYNTGAVNAIDGYAGVGGVVGYNYEDGTVTNCYYLTGTCTVGIGYDYGTGSAEEKAEEEFISGEVTWLLNGQQAEGVWKQTLRTNAYPTFRGDTVFQVPNYITGEVTYSNTESEPDNISGSQPKPVVHPTLKQQYTTLSLEEEVQYNIFFTIDNTGDVMEMGLIIFNSGAPNATIAQVLSNAVYNSETDTYMVHTDGIPAKNLGDNVYFKVYAKLRNGTYVYSEMTSYSAVQYVNNDLEKDKNPKLHALVVAMLNYGAAAQTQFNYKTDSLMNAGLPQDLEKDYMLAPLVDVDSKKVGVFGTDQAGFSSGSATISLGGAFAINYYFTPSQTVDGDMTLYYWTKADYGKADKLTADNASGCLTMKFDETQNAYRGSVTGITAKQIDETVFVAAAYEHEGVTYYTGVTPYSVGAYCKWADEWAEQNANANLQALAEATAVYGYYAKTFFA